MQRGMKAEPSVITVGTFDGVHLGHRAVVGKVVEDARRRGARPLVITFEPHPLAVVAPERMPGLLESPVTRCRRIESMGAVPVLLEFNEELRRKTAAEWMEILRRDYGAVEVVAGYDNTFGCDGLKMSIHDYRSLGEALGVDVEEAPIVEGISSSAIREALGRGDVERASEMLGYPYRISGRVVHGKGLGHRLGYPTANVIPDGRFLLPANGVYAADAELLSGEVRRAVVNVGKAPTVGSAFPVTVEAYITDFGGNLYDREIALDFLHRLRDERKFPSVEELTAQIRADVEAARSL